MELREMIAELEGCDEKVFDAIHRRGLDSELQVLRDIHESLPDVIAALRARVDHPARYAR